jgi:uncharacterized RmlC-like cupin family protein
MPQPSVVGPGQRTAPAAQATPGMHREEAYAADDRWIGIVQTSSGTKSGWHHHGQHDTYLYVLRGAIVFEYGPGGSESRTMRAGDFAHMPAGTVHRESTPAGADGEAVIVRIGRGPAVVNVEGPDPDGPGAA